MTVLVTGGMGYIGSHTCVELLEQGMDVVVVDNLVNSSAEAGRRVEQITGRPLKFIRWTCATAPGSTAFYRAED